MQFLSASNHLPFFDTAFKIKLRTHFLKSHNMHPIINFGTREFDTADKPKKLQFFIPAKCTKLIGSNLKAVLKENELI